MLRIAGIVRESIVDGPGLRFVVFTQGCPHHCPHCHNPQSHDFEGGYLIEPERILEEYKKNPLLAGMTFSGGEPTLQPEGLLPLAKAVVESGKNNVIFSGYTFEELMKRCETEPALEELLGLCRYLIDGRYIHEQRDLTLHFRGSRNQRIIDLPASLPTRTPVTVEL